jgi:hypothetical protein
MLNFLNSPVRNEINGIILFRVVIIAITDKSSRMYLYKKVAGKKTMINWVISVKTITPVMR